MKKRYARILAATLSAAMVFTSAPTAAFATELSVSKDAVEAEGAVVDADIDDLNALFPSKITTVYGTGELTAVKADGNNFDLDAVEVSGAANIGTLKVGEKTKVTLKATALDDKDYSALPGAEVKKDEEGNVVSVKFTREFDVECVKAVYGVDVVNAIKASEPATIKAQYGTGKVELLKSDNKENTDWTVKSATSAVATTTVADATVVKGAVIQTVATYDSKKYDTDKLVESLNGDNTAKPYAFNASTGKIEKTVNVTVVNAKIDIDSINFPTAIPATFVVGQKVSVSMPTASNGRFVVYAATDAVVNNDYDKKTNDVTFNKAGKNESVKVAFIPDANYEVTGTSKYSAITMDSTYAVKSGYTVEVAKERITDIQPKLKAAAADLKYGTTYADVLACVNQPTSAKFKYTLKSNKTTDVVPVGTQKIALLASITDEDYENYELAAGAQKATVYVTVEIKKPEVSAKIFGDDDAEVVSYGVKNEGTKAVSPKVSFGTYADSKLSKDIDYELKYVWYKNGDKVGTSETYAIDQTLLGANTYKCVITVADKENIDAAKKAILDQVVPTRTIETKEITVTATHLSSAKIENEGTLTNTNALTYGYTDTMTIEATFDYGTTGYSYVSADAYVEDKDGKQTKLTDIRKKTTESKVTLSAVVPSGLSAGDYNVYFVANSEKDKDKDVAVASAKLKVKQKDVTAEALKVSKVKFEYGTKLSDISVTNNMAYGSYVLSTELNKEYPVPVDDCLYADFVQTDEQKNNYNVTVPAANKKIAITVDKKEIVVAAKDIELVVGDKLPDEKTLEFTYDKLVNRDEFEDQGVKVTLVYAKGLENKIKEVGTYEDAVEITLSAATSPYYTFATKTGTVVVKAATAPTTPVVKPTPAPVKQATAAAPKAAKAKATVKVGKKYTLKLKYAAGKKATVKKIKWTSSKKSVATVSSKGKVTAKKAGKATIYARVYFKDGSMKKIKFTVTVK